MGKGSINILDLKGDDKEFLKGLVINLNKKYEKVCTKMDRLKKSDAPYIVTMTIEILLQLNSIQKQLRNFVNETLNINISYEMFRKKKNELRNEKKFQEIFCKLITPTICTKRVDMNIGFDYIIIVLFTNFCKSNNNKEFQAYIKDNTGYDIENAYINSMEVYELQYCNTLDIILSKNFKFPKNKIAEFKYKNRWKNKIGLIPMKWENLSFFEKDLLGRDKYFELADLLYHQDRKQLKKIINGIVSIYKEKIFGQNTIKKRLKRLANN